ncbi:LysR family transcriptional regulator [Streptomyces sp. NPDC090741]|uniref:LysR family transcriptional regulator n=1 Tax=Streptomyces sp. NPDC090741 TaxID=3365967 RepID=UPI0038223045
MQRLRVLRAVAEHGSFDRAATALRPTPSAVSQLSTGRALLTVATFTSGGRLLLPAALSRLMALPQGHRFANRDALDLAEPAAEPWVLGCLKTEEEACREHGIALARTGLRLFHH